MCISFRDTCLAALKAQFKIPSSSLRVYVHYQPTYYHFHVHFSHVKMNFGAFFLCQLALMGFII